MEREKLLRIQLTRFCLRYVFDMIQIDPVLEEMILEKLDINEEELKSIFYELGYEIE